MGPVSKQHRNTAHPVACFCHEMESFDLGPACSIHYGCGGAHLHSYGKTEAEANTPRSFQASLSGLCIMNNKETLTETRWKIRPGS